MRVGVGQDVERRAVLAENAQNAVYIAALLRAGVEFAVRIGARTALAKRVVALGVDPLLARNHGAVGLARTHIFAALQHDGAAT